MLDDCNTTVPVASAAIAAARAVTEGSDSGAMSFPDALRCLAEAGIESYYADLIRSERTFYLPDGGSHRTRSALRHDAVAETFSGNGIKAALTAIQTRQTDYAGFCDRIAAAGCFAYFVTLRGRQALYFGRSGEVYVEAFPPAA